jgi:hypothetical protein
MAKKRRTNLEQVIAQGAKDRQYYDHYFRQFSAKKYVRLFL